MRRIFHLGAVCAALGMGLMSGVAPAKAAPSGITPDQLAHVGDAGQVIIVTADSWRSQTAVLRAFERDGSGGWREVVGATPARLGWGGLVRGDQRKQGSGTTPAGTYAITRAFGRLPDPGTSMPYRQFDHDDSWTYDPGHPRTYNLFQTTAIPWRDYGGYAEHLWAKGPQYRYVAVLDFNLPGGPITTAQNGIRYSKTPPDTRRGGGIFLHVTKNRSTAGCIAIPLKQMRRVLTWLTPARHPVIVIGPESAITKL